MRIHGGCLKCFSNLVRKIMGSSNTFFMFEMRETPRQGWKSRKIYWSKKCMKSENEKLGFNRFSTFFRQPFGRIGF